MGGHNLLSYHLCLTWLIYFLRSNSIVIASSVSESGPFDNRYIVKIDSSKTNSLEDFCHHLNKLGINHSVAHDYTQLDPKSFYGASIRLQDLSQVKALRELEAVQSISPVTIVKPISPVGSQQILSKPLRTARNPNAYAPHVQTRISDLHAMGYYGQGVKVALIDSGVDCSHPALGGAFGPGHKIGFGYDLVGDDFNGHNEPKPKPSPCTPCANHGTHTAGIVGAADVGFGFQGVAPNATLGMYLIGCETEGGTGNDIIVSAILMAARDGADVISASIGGVGGWATGDALSNLVNNLFTKGITLILAAGNEGNEGLFFAESPAAATHSLSVGSVESMSEIVAKFATSRGRNLSYFTGGLFNGSNFKVFATSPTSNISDDACKPLPGSTPNLSNSVVLIRRGSCTYTTKAQNVAAKGAGRVLFYMNSTENATVTNYMSGVQVATISKDDGEWLLQQSHSDPNFTVSFPEALHTYVATPRGGFVSDFSQYGPTYDFKNLAPAFLGVGGQIVSTVPLKMGRFSSMSGTSMATPQIGGIVALVKGIRGRNFPVGKLRRILSTTAQQVFAGPGRKDVETVTHQGGGLVDAFCAAFANTSLSTQALSLDDLNHFKGVQSFEIVNEGSRTLSYTVGHIPANTVSTFRPGNHRVSTEVKPLPGSSAASVSTNPSSFQLGPGAKQTITVTFRPPSGIDLSLLAVYSGYISLNQDPIADPREQTSEVECDSHTLPYYGIAGVMKEQKIIDHGPDTSGFESIIQPRLTDGNRRPRPNSTFTFSHGDGVSIRHRFAFGSQHTRIDVVPANASFAQGPSSTEPIPTMVEVGKNFTLSKHTFRGVSLVGLVPDSNSTYTSRTAGEDTVVQSWDGTVIPPHDQKKTIRVPNGAYRLLIRALLVNGNPLNDWEYDTWLSPEVIVARTPDWGVVDPPSSSSSSSPSVASFPLK